MKKNITNKKTPFFKTIKSSGIIYNFFALLIALLIGAIIIAASGFNPLKSYSAMFDGAFGSLKAIGKTLSKSTPLIFTGLSVTLAYRCGMINIGAEGQLYMGAISSVSAALLLDKMPPFLAIPLIIIAGCIGGGLYALIPAILKIKKGLNEVIVTIMLNYVAILFVEYMVSGPLKAEGNTPKTELINPAFRYIKLIDKTQLTVGLIIAILAAIIVWFLLFKTTPGYEMRAIGQNPTAAKTAGIFTNHRMIQAMVLSGILAGLAGTNEVLGTYGYCIANFSPGYGYDGISIAMMAGSHPIGSIFSAILFGALRVGSGKMDMVTNIPKDFVLILQALIIMFIATPQLIKYIPTTIKKVTKREAK